MSFEFQRTSGSPLNKSTSKQLYSFSKSIRFKPIPPPLSKKTFYDIKKGALENRTTTFGYGNKMEFASKQLVPPVGNYEFSNQFINNREKRRGYSFGKTSKKDILINPEKTKRIPGPGAYYNKSISLSVDRYQSLSYSMREKTDDPMQKNQNKLGPGQYETISGTSPKGTYFVSRFTSSGCRKIGREKRAQMANRSETPGPGKYRGENSVNLNKTGVYFNSKVKNMEANRFSIIKRPPLGDDNKVPGPGSYIAFTQFGRINRSWAKD